MPHPCHAALAAILVLASAAAAAQTGTTGTWKWRDAAGRIHLSDTPPPQSVPERNILERPVLPGRANAANAANAVNTPAPTDEGAAAKPTSPAPQPIGRPDPELEARRKAAADAQDAAKRAAEEKNTAVKAENCARAKSHMAALADGQRIARTNDKGEREVLDDKGRADEMQRARAIIATDCRG